jgi:hypothetical protein
MISPRVMMRGVAVDKRDRLFSTSEDMPVPHIPRAFCGEEIADSLATQTGEKTSVGKHVPIEE